MDKDIFVRSDELFMACLEPGSDLKYFKSGDFLISLAKLMRTFDFNDCDHRLFDHLTMAYHYAKLEYLKRRKEFLEEKR